MGSDDGVNSVVWSWFASSDSVLMVMFLSDNT